MSFTFNQANNYLQSGQYSKARDIYLEIIAIHPSNHKAHHLMALSYCRENRFEEGIEWFKKALLLESNQAIYHHNYATALFTLNRLESAQKHYQQSLLINPFYRDALFNLGIVHLEQGHWKEARDHFKKLIQLEPQNPRGHYQLGLIYQYMEQNNKALEHFDTVLNLQEDHHEAAINKAGLLKKANLPGEAMTSYHQILSLHPHSQEAHYNLGLMYLEQGFFEKAHTHIRKGISSFSILPLSPCSSSLLFLTHYDPHLSQQTLQNDIQNWGKKLESAIPVFNHKVVSKNKIRVGFVSPDFRNHAANSFVYLLLKSLVHNDFEIICFSDVKHPDQWTKKYQELSKEWYNISHLNDTQLAHFIHKQSIDILVDPGVGHTDQNRLITFAHQCAPLQISNYPTDTGLSRIQYRISDQIVSPNNQANIIQLPHSLFCYLPPEKAPVISELPALKNNYVTFGAFHQLPKLNLPLLFLWAEILKGVPHSKLLLKNRGFKSSIIQQRIGAIFTELGIPPERILYYAHSASRSEHLALYNQIDISLDSFPYNGMTTSCESFWMGVPVVTLSHEQPFSRITKSYLNTLKALELSAQSPQDYIHMAIQLAHNREQMNLYRKHLRDRMRNSPLCNQDTYFEFIRATFKQLWSQMKTI